MSGTSTPSRKLSRTTTRVAPPSRRNAFSCNSAQMRELERKVRKRAALRLQPSTITNSRVRRYFLVCVFSWSRHNHRAWLQWLVSAQLAHVALDRLIAPVEPIFGYQVLPDCGGIPTAAQT